MTITSFHTTITAITLIAAIISFIREKTPPHITAFAAMSVLLLTGVLHTKEVLSVFSNSAPITIAAMFIIGAALKSTGIIDQMGYYVVRAAEKNYWLAMFAFYGCILLLSAFMNNTPIVIVMTPVVIMMAKKFDKYPSKFLIPLSYMAIMGGTCTLIGTSTNLLVNGIVISSHLPSFNIFEITAPGFILALIGIFYLVTIGRRLLPNRPLLSSDTFETENVHTHFTSVAMVLADSVLIGKSLDELKFPENKNCYILDIIRYDNSLSESLTDETSNENTSQTKKIDYLLRQIPLEAFDRLVIQANKKELLNIHKLPGLSVGDHPALTQLREAEETVVMEGIIGPRSRLIHNKISSSWIRRAYNCHILAACRRGKMIKDHLSKTVLQFGDTLLIEGPPKKLAELFKNEEILSLTKFQKPTLNRKSLLSLFTIISVVGLAAFNFMPIAGLAIIGAVFVMITKCVTPRMAYKTIDWRIMMLIFGMLALSISMEKTGIAHFVVAHTAGFSKEFGPRATLATIYFITSLLTEFMTNNAIAVLITPLAIGLSLNLGYDPKPFIAAVMFAASASFATPLGYQTNTYVYNAGNYKFTDFLKVGVPLNLLNFVAAIFVIPYFFPFH